MKRRYPILMMLGILSFSLTGCPPKKQMKEEEPVIEDSSKPEEEPSLRGKDYQEVAEISSVYFDLDQATLRSDARDALSRNYQVIKGHDDWEVLVEGHCDDRGTTEYNLGLGQKRAAAVRSYYMSLGMRGSKVATISYGKESPICTEQSEDCWSKNRRGATKVRASAKK
jgi:peptidoglycan-associated lipoprotein